MENTEQQEPKKKGHIICRVLRWIWRILLAFLLIFGVLFQGPWKVLTLLAIFLLACTILPRQHRKWFWATVGIVLIILIIWVFLPDDNEGWRPYTLDEELARLEAARETVPDEENAAILYNQLIEDYNESDLEPNFPNEEIDEITLSEYWSSEQYPQVADWLQGHKELIEKLIHIGKMEKCRFAPVVDVNAFSKHTKIMSPIRHWVHLLIRSGNNDIGEGKIESAIEKYQTVQSMAAHLYQQPVLIDMIIAIALDAVATRSYKQAIFSDSTEEKHLQQIKLALDTKLFDWQNKMPRIVAYEKLYNKNVFAMLYEINPKGKIRLRRNPYEMIKQLFWRQFLGENQCKSPDYWLKKQLKLAFLFEWFIMPSDPMQVSKTIDSFYEKHYAVTKPDYDWTQERKRKRISLSEIKLNYRFLLQQLFEIISPSYRSSYELYLRWKSDRIGGKILIALQRYKNQHNAWPKGLDDIKDFTDMLNFVDPLNDGEYVYKLTDECFVLYSKGLNGIDENGIRSYREKADDFLIWPRKLPKDNNNQEAE